MTAMINCLGGLTWKGTYNMGTLLLRQRTGVDNFLDWHPLCAPDFLVAAISLHNCDMVIKGDCVWVQTFRLWSARTRRNAGGGSVTPHVQNFILENCTGTNVAGGQNFTYVETILKTVIAEAELSSVIVIDEVELMCQSSPS